MAEKRKAEDSVDDTAEKKAAPEAGMVEVPIKEALEQATKALQAVGWDKDNAALQVFFAAFTRARRARRARGGGWELLFIFGSWGGRRRWPDDHHVCISLSRLRPRPRFIGAGYRVSHVDEWGGGQVGC